MKVTASFERPECNDKCKECEWLKITDTSFDHELGTEYREEWDCTADIDTLELYGECAILEEVIDENFSKEVVADMTVEVY